MTKKALRAFHQVVNNTILCQCFVAKDTSRRVNSSGVMPIQAGDVTFGFKHFLYSFIYHLFILLFFWLCRYTHFTLNAFFLLCHSSYLKKSHTHFPLGFLPKVTGWNQSATAGMHVPCTQNLVVHKCMRRSITGVLLKWLEEHQSLV